MDTLIACKDWFLLILHWIPFRDIAADLVLGFLFSLLAGIGLVVILQRSGLLTRRNRFYNVVVKIFWFYIPTVFLMSGLQIAITHTCHHAISGLIDHHRVAIRDLNQQFLGQLQKQLDVLLKQDSNLQDLSVGKLLDLAFAQVDLRQIPNLPPIIQEYADKLIAAPFLKAQLKKQLSAKTGDLTKLDETSVKLLFDKTLQEMVQADFLLDLAQQRLRLLAYGLYQGAVVHLLILLILPGLEILVASWRKW